MERARSMVLAIQSKRRMQTRIRGLKLVRLYAMVNVPVCLTISLLHERRQLGAFADSQCAIQRREGTSQVSSLRRSRNAVASRESTGHFPIPCSFATRRAQQHHASRITHHASRITLHASHVVCPRIAIAPRGRTRAHRCNGVRAR
jgi:hypothetical protein